MLCESARQFSAQEIIHRILGGILEMGIMDKVSKTFGLSNDEEEKTAESTAKEELQAPNFEPPKENPSPPQGGGFSGHNVLDFNSAMSQRENPSSMPRTNTLVKSKITTVRPTSFDDAQTVANCLRDKIPVIINFENTNTDDAKRIIDFISGTTYAINGVIRKVSQNVFVCAPSNVTVTYTEEEKKSVPEFSWITK